MSQLAERLRERKIKPSPRKKYQIAGHFGFGSQYGPYPGDRGLILPKLLGLARDADLLRLGYIDEYNGKDSFECGKCGNKFVSMATRDFHFRKRHGERHGPVVKNLEELTEKQKQILKAELQQDYYTNPADFMVPDPEDSIIQQDERIADETAPLRLDKTKASRGIKRG